MNSKQPTWSNSKIDLLWDCPWKFEQVYKHKRRQDSAALALGNYAYVILDDAITSENADPNWIDERIVQHRTQMEPMIPHISKFVEDLNNWKTSNNIENIKVENKYAVNRDLEATQFLSDDAYVRGVIDLWAMIRGDTLVVIDHKTNSRKGGFKDTKDSKQLKLYVWMLTESLKLEWKVAKVCMHYVKFGAKVWATYTRQEYEVIKHYIQNILTISDSKFKKYEQSGYPATWNKWCAACQFKPECPRVLEQLEVRGIEQV